LNWDEKDDERAPRQFGWGCAIAAIIGAATAIIAFIIVLNTVASVFTE
jgi:hypothetical protein